MIFIQTIDKAIFFCNNSLTIQERFLFRSLDDAIYMKMHNDVALLINNYLSLYEHQSTRNPNLPLRGLLYFAELYRQLTKDQHIYSSKLIKLPTPCFIVFYNGNADIGEGEVLKLSDAFYHGNEQSQMELYATVLNINHGHNKQLLESCQSLSDYAAFVDRVKRHSKSMAFADGVNLAIDECIQEGILKDFLMTRREQVMSSMLSEYNEEEVLAMLSKEYYEDGKSDGIAEGRAEAILLLLEEIGTVDDGLRDSILRERDNTILKRLLKLAAKAETIAEFKHNM